MQQNIRPQGFALVMVLLMLSILLMLVATLISRTRGSSQMLGVVRDQIQSQYAAEAGVADTLSQLSANSSWNTTVTSVAVNPSQPDPSYSVTWAASSSVNNLNGSAPADGPRGPGSIPPGYAYMVVRGQSRAENRTLEVMVSRAGPIDPGQAILAGGNITMSGGVQISGEKSTQAPGTVDANVVSTSSGATTVTMGQSAASAANVGGQVQTDGTSMNIGPYATISGGTPQVGQAVAPPPTIDVGGKVVAKSSAPGVTLSSGTSILGTGDFYLGSSTTHTGDIVLNGSNLYINGDLNLNGTIKGTGSVYVNGTTSMSGDATVVTGDPHMMALMSKGDVTLKGVDGAGYMNTILPTLGNDPFNVPYTQDWANAQAYVQGAYNAAAQGPSIPANHALPYNPTFVTNDGGIDNVMKFGNGAAAGSGTSEMDYYGDLLSVPNASGLGQNPITILHDKLAAQPPSSANTFMLNKLSSLSDGQGAASTSIFHPHTAAGAAADIDAFNITGVPAGIVDALNDQWGVTTISLAEKNRLYSMLVNALGQISYNGLGSAYFNGVIYTQGNLFVQDDIRIQGAIVAGGNMTLTNKVDITFIPNAAAAAGSSSGALAVKMWLKP